MRTDDSKSLKAGFVEIMEAKIFSGELKPGDRLPPERELAVQLGISRGSVNQGILDMARMGFLSIVPRRGTFVADYKTIGKALQKSDNLLDSAIFLNFCIDIECLKILLLQKCTFIICANLPPFSVVKFAQKFGATLICFHKNRFFALTHQMRLS